MDKITEYEVIRPDGEVVPYIHILRGDGSFVTMTKSVYDAQVEHLTEISTPEQSRTL